MTTFKISTICFVNGLKKMLRNLLMK